MGDRAIGVCGTGAKPLAMIELGLKYLNLLYHMKALLFLRYPCIVIAMAAMR